VKARASRTAFIVASVPEFVKRRLSSDGMRRGDRLGQADLVLGRAGNDRPFSATPWTAFHHVTVGVPEHEARVVVVEVETLDAVGIPDVRALAALEVERVTGRRTWWSLLPPGMTATASSCSARERGVFDAYSVTSCPDS